MKRGMKRIKVNVISLYHVWFADHIVILDDSNKQTYYTLRALTITLKQWALEINVKKTKLMTRRVEVKSKTWQ